MSRWMNGWALGAIAIFLWCGTALAGPADDAFEKKIEAELGAIDPGAVEVFQRANAAREREDHDAAEKLYAEVSARAPSFIHAERRRCGQLADLGRRAEAIALCRDAVAKDPSGPNYGALAGALYQMPKGETAPGADLDEAYEDLERAEKLEPNEAYIAGEQCQLAMIRNSHSDLVACSERLQQLAPDTQPAISASWILAMSEARWSDAAKLIARGKAAHLPPAMLEEMQRETDAAIPWTTKALKWALIVIGGWGALSLVLVLAGTILSHITLRTAEAWTPESAKRSALIRAIYKQVLLVSSALYYASLPLVLVLTFVAAGGIVYGMFAVGYIPIKLGLILAVGAFGSAAAIIKSLTFRPNDEAPGIKLDLSREPELVATLKEVADRIGTRPVDTVYLAPDTSMSVFERQGGERCLVLGAGVLEGLPLAAFKAILAHEYGHFSNRDTAGGGFALRVRRSLILLIVGLARSGHAKPWNLAWWFANGYHRIFLRVSQGASRLQEILADRHAAEAYGGAAFATGLKHVILSDLKFEPHINGEIKRALNAKEPLANLWTPPPASTEDVSLSQKFDEALNRAPSPYDSHPSPRDRIRWVERIAGSASAEAEPSSGAWSLFSERARHERELTLIVYQRLAASGVRPVALPAPQHK